MTLCRDCRIGSAEILSDVRQALLEAASKALVMLDVEKEIIGYGHGIADALRAAIAKAKE